MMSHQAFLSWLHVRFSTADYEHHSAESFREDFLARLEFKSLVTNFYCQPLIKYFKRVDRANSNFLSLPFLFMYCHCFHVHHRRIPPTSTIRLFSKIQNTFRCIFIWIGANFHLHFFWLESTMVWQQWQEESPMCAERWEKFYTSHRFCCASPLVLAMFVGLCFSSLVVFLLFLIQSSLRFRSEWFALFSHSIVHRQLINVTKQLKQISKKKNEAYWKLI